MANAEGGGGISKMKTLSLFALGLSEYTPNLTYLLKLSIDERNKEYNEAESVFQIFTKTWLEMRLN